jgi:hypothetical protein
MPIRVKILNDSEPGVQARVVKLTPEGFERSVVEVGQGSEFVISDPHQKLEIIYAPPAPAAKEGA